MKLTTASKLRRQGFTLIEMIGVLAVIAILAAVLIPKVFEAINNARVSNAAMTCQTAKTACADHYAKFGSLTSSNNTSTLTLPYADFDKVLLAETFLDKPFAVKIGDGLDANNNVSLTAATGAGLSATGPDYDLDGDGTIDTAATTTVVEAVISAAALEDARSLDRLIDGVSLSYTGVAVSDLRGRVKWAQQGSTGTYDIRVYLTHR